MFGLSFSESFFILLIFVLFVKPEDYPKIIKTVGNIYRSIMTFYYRCIDAISDIK